MDILKNDNYKHLIIAVLLVCSSLCVADDPAQALAKSYGLPGKFTAETAQLTIDELNNLLQTCENNELACRIKYQIGMLYFKTDELAKSCGYFAELSRLPQCPELIKLCSLNMAGQIHRMEARDNDALEAFKDVIEFSAKYPVQDPNKIEQLPQMLRQAAFFARAEIYQYQQKYQQAIEEYKKLGEDIEKAGYQASDHGAVAMDRLSQLYIMSGEADNYIEISQTLLKKYPGYYRNAIINFETEAVAFLNKQQAKVDFSRGSIDAPVKLILFLKDNKKKEQTEKFVKLLHDLKNQYQGTYSGVAISYHYAWLLDAVGKKQEAITIFEGIGKDSCKAVPQQDGTGFLLATLTDYARLQQSILLGEAGNYKNALEAIGSVVRDPNNAHVSELAGSIEKSLETLKREVPKDANAK